jgi:tetratricopeptide (TPR) repeat protein
MPKRDIATITHAALTDHSIAARPGEPYPEEAFPSHALRGTGLLHLSATPGETPSSVPAVTLLRAYLDLIRDGHQEFALRMDDLLNQLAQSAPTNSVVLVALANRAAAKNTPASRAAAIGYLARAIQNGATAPEDFLLLAELYGRDNRHAEAIKTLEKGLAANPFFRELYEAAASHQLALGQLADALKTIHKGLDLFPDDRMLRILESEVQR